MSSSLDISESLVTAIRHGVAVQAMTLAGFVALVYDHILTLDVEINLIWGRRPGLVSVIFLINRYTVPLMLIVDLYEFAATSTTSALFCKVWTTVQGALTIASFMSIHAIVALRVHALHNGEKWIARILWLSGTLYAVSTAGIMIAGSIHIIPGNEPTNHACVTSIPSFLWAAWLPSIIFESVLFVLTLLALLVHDKDRSFTALTIILYRDGMLYFLVVAFCSMFSLLVWAFAPPSLLGLARYFALAFVNIAVSRLILNLKTYAAQKENPDDDWDTPMPHSTLGFSPPPLPPLPDIEHNSVNTSEESPFDIEMYDIEREYQQLGTKIH